MTTPATPRLLSEPHCVWDAGATLGEGTCWSVREQSLWWVDILAHRLLRYTPSTGARRSWDFDETISAVSERASAPGLIVTLQHGFALFNPVTGALRRLQAPEPERPNNRFNDGKCDAEGRFWAGTMDFDCIAPTGALYRYIAAAGAGDEGAAPERFGTCVRALDAGFAVTNGPTWSQDGRTMFFNDTVRREVSAFDADPATGEVNNGRVWLRFAPQDGHPDGMTTDADGRLWIAHWGAACVTCHEPLHGAELLRMHLPTSHITDVAFGGAELDTLYVTSARSGLSEGRLESEPLAGGLFAVRTNVRGCAANLFGG